MKYKLTALFALLAIFSSCQLGNYLIHHHPGIMDYKIFPYRDLHANNQPFMFPKGRSTAGMIPGELTVKGKEVTIDHYLKSNNTVAFLIIQNDTLVYEKYFGGYDSSSIVPSFSMAKSYLSALIGCAIEDHFIESVDEPVTDYIPELKRNGFEKVTIKHLLQMTSGLDFGENNYGPFGEAGIFYYGTDLRQNTIHLTLKREPGKAFDFTSGSTQMLGLILERAIKQETITHYFERKIWFPLEMEFDGSWSIDRNNGMEKTFCCLNARARDFAKFGRLYLNKGKWNGRQIIPEKWVNESLAPDLTNGGVNYFKYQWWLYENDPDQAFYARGELGQFIYVNPKKNLVIVRLGKDNGDGKWLTLFTSYASNILQ